MNQVNEDISNAGTDYSHIFCNCSDACSEHTNARCFGLAISNRLKRCDPKSGVVPGQRRCEHKPLFIGRGGGVASSGIERPKGRPVVSTLHAGSQQGDFRLSGSDEDADLIWRLREQNAVLKVHLFGQTAFRGLPRRGRWSRRNSAALSSRYFRARTPGFTLWTN